MPPESALPVSRPLNEYGPGVSPTAHIESFRGLRPTLDPSNFVASGASIIGDVDLGALSSVWYGAVLRGDVQPIYVGARSSIQDNAVAHATSGWVPTRIGDDVTVGHGAILHGCTLRDRVIVGMGSIVLDGAEVAPDVIIGAGSLVTTRAQIPSGVLALGRPAKPVRDLTDHEIQSILESSKIYVKHTEEYRQRP